MGSSGVSTGYTIDQSIRFNSADSAYMHRTPSSSGNRKTFTSSFWVKLGDTTDCALPMPSVAQNVRNFHAGNSPSVIAAGGAGGGCCTNVWNGSSWSEVGALPFKAEGNKCPICWKINKNLRSLLEKIFVSSPD